MNEKAKYYIKKLDLIKHPEGGYFKEIYRANEMYYVDQQKKSIKRNASTSIYFLLDGRQVSKFHRLKSDELWHFYDGSAIKLYVINEAGEFSTILLGNDLASGEVFQVVIRKNSWFAAEVLDKKSYSLIGCTVSPGFDFTDFELASRKNLMDQFPHYKVEIFRFTNPE